MKAVFTNLSDADAINRPAPNGNHCSTISVPKLREASKLDAVSIIHIIEKTTGVFQLVASIGVSGRRKNVILTSQQGEERDWRNLTKLTGHIKKNYGSTALITLTLLKPTELK